MFDDCIPHHWTAAAGGFHYGLSFVRHWAELFGNVAIACILVHFGAWAFHIPIYAARVGELDIHGWEAKYAQDVDGLSRSSLAQVWQHGMKKEMCVVNHELTFYSNSCNSWIDHLHPFTINKSTSTMFSNHNPIYHIANQTYIASPDSAFISSQSLPLKTQYPSHQPDRQVTPMECTKVAVCRRSEMARNIIKNP